MVCPTVSVAVAAEGDDPKQPNNSIAPPPVEQRAKAIRVADPAATLCWWTTFTFVVYMTSIYSLGHDGVLVPLREP